MGMVQSLRDLADHIAGFGGDPDDDEEAYQRDLRYEERRMMSRMDAPSQGFEAIYGEEHRGAPQSSREARPLRLVRTPQLGFGTLAPSSFEEAPQIADRFRRDVPVIVDLQGCEEQLAVRLTDFCSGLVYALEGSLQLIERRVLLLVPRDVELSGGATADIRAGAFFNQL